MITINLLCPYLIYHQELDLCCYCSSRRRYLQIHFEFNQSCNLEEVKTDSEPAQISVPYYIISEPYHQLVNHHVQHTTFQAKIRNRLFKPLKLPYYLNYYPLDFFEYLPWFTGEDHVTVEKHSGAFENFVDNFEILHEDVVMRLFSKSLAGDVAFWFRNLEAHSICSWTEFYNSFSRY